MSYCINVPLTLEWFRKIRKHHWKSGKSEVRGTCIRVLSLTFSERIVLGREGGRRCGNGRKSAVPPRTWQQRHAIWHSFSGSLTCHRSCHKARCLHVIAVQAKTRRKGAHNNFGKVGIMIKNALTYRKIILIVVHQTTLFGMQECINMNKPTFYAKPKLKLGGTWRHICFPNMSSIKNNLRSAQVCQATAQKWPGIVKPWTCEPLRPTKISQHQSTSTICRAWKYILQKAV